MKIVMICDLFLENLNYQENLLAKYYVKNGHDVVILSSTFSSVFDYLNNTIKIREATETLHLGIKIIKRPYSLNILNRFRRLSGVSRILKTENPDLIFLHGIHLNLREAINYKNKINKNCKVIFDYHGDFSNSGKNWLSIQLLHKILWKQFLYIYLKKVDKIFYVTPSSANFLNQVYSIPYDNMHLLYLGADVDLIYKKKSENIRNIIRSKFLIDKTDLVIFSGGKLTPSKKTELLIEAFFKLNNKKSHLFIIGDSSEKDTKYKNELLKKSKSNKRIHFIGWLSSDDVYDYMIASDLAVYPSSQSVLWQQSICSELPLIVGLVNGQEINYMNKFNAIEAIPEEEIDYCYFEKTINKYLNDSYLIEKKKAAIKTREEMLDYNKIILKTLD